MQEPQAYIEEIKNRQLKSDKEFILDSLSGAIDRLGKAFPRYGSFLMEFVQNADDAASRSLRIELLNNAIRISNDGDVFSEQDVRSICKVGRSSKTPKDYIGYLGVGFKSVFLISEQPEIHSGGYRFRFDKSFWAGSEYVPWQVIPVWIESTKEISPDYKTMFVLPLKAPDLIKKLREEVKPAHLNNRILLFLRNIVQIDVMNATESFTRRIVKSEISKATDYEIYQVKEYENDELSIQDQWLVFRKICDVPLDVKDDYITKEWERGDVKKREIVVAFRLNSDFNLVREYRGTAHIGVFSFLPLKEIPSGLNFLLQADFLTVPGRGDLSRECLWNDWLSTEIYELIVSRCITAFLKHDQWKMNFVEILFSTEGGHELFEQRIKTPLNTYLKNSAVLIAEDGTAAKAEELVYISEEVRALLGDIDLSLVYPNRKALHRECKPSQHMGVKKVPEELDRFLRFSEGDVVVEIKAKEGDVQWFNRLYGMYVSKYSYKYFQSNFTHYNVEHDRFWERVRTLRTPIVLTSDCNVARVDNCYINAKNIIIPENVKGNFNIVHPAVVKDERFEEFRRMLNDVRYHATQPRKKIIRELTEEDIRSAVKTHEALALDEHKWKKMSENERTGKIKELKELWSRGYLSVEGYKFITLKSKSGYWLNPSELILSKEYGPEHRLEEISVEKELMDLPIEFVSPEFIDGEDDQEIKGCRNFLKELGVERKLDESKFRKDMVQRIGILTALRFERSQKRTARELSRSEETGGYDIIPDDEESEEGHSLIQSEERYIEVKSSSKPNPDIFLTTRQYHTMIRKQEKYFVYVVKDALRFPSLYVVRGDKLSHITDMKVIIPFSKWTNEAEEEFKP